MGRVDRLMERRRIRRSSELALLYSMFDQPSQSLTHEGPAPLGFESREPTTEPIPVAVLNGFAPQVTDVATEPDVDERPWGSGFVAPASGDALMFEVSQRRPWYRTRKAALVAVACAVAALLVAAILVMVRNPSAESDTAPVVAPSPATTAAVPSEAQQVPVSVDPNPSGVPAPPPPPPPPAPPLVSAAEVAPPPSSDFGGGRNYQPPRQNSSGETSKPEIGVTRTPTTRAPISVAPPTRSAPSVDSSAPGDSNGSHRGWGPGPW